MFISKNLRELDKEIIHDEAEAENARATNKIHIKLTSRDQLFSEYAFSDGELNVGLSEYVCDKCKTVPFGEVPTVVVHSDCDLSAEQISALFKSNYRTEYVAARKKVTRNTLFSLIMTTFGIITLSILFAVHYVFDNAYVKTVLEIAAWVFIWEAVDSLFLRRPALKSQCLILQRAYSAKIELAPDVETE